MPLLCHFSIILNAATKGYFPASRGLQQGDALSPFLFTLVVDALSQIIITVKLKGLFNGFQVGSDIVNVSHLQFAVDTLILMDWDHKYGHIFKPLI